MKKLVLSVVTVCGLLFVASCNNGDLNKVTEDYDVVIIDGCEYIIFDRFARVAGSGYGHMAHKGNCSNPIHCHNQ